MALTVGQHHIIPPKNKSKDMVLPKINIGSEIQFSHLSKQHIPFSRDPVIATIKSSEYSFPSGLIYPAHSEVNAKSNGGVNELYEPNKKHIFWKNKQNATRKEYYNEDFDEIDRVSVENTSRETYLTQQVYINDFHNLISKRPKSSKESVYYDASNNIDGKLESYATNTPMRCLDSDQKIQPNNPDIFLTAEGNPSNEKIEIGQTLINDKKAIVNICGKNRVVGDHSETIKNIAPHSVPTHYVNHGNLFCALKEGNQVIDMSKLINSSTTQSTVYGIDNHALKNIPRKRPKNKTTGKKVKSRYLEVPSLKRELMEINRKSIADRHKLRQDLYLSQKVQDLRKSLHALQNYQSNEMMAKYPEPIQDFNINSKNCAVRSETDLCINSVILENKRALIEADEEYDEKQNSKLSDYIKLSDSNHSPQFREESHLHSHRRASDSQFPFNYDTKLGRNESKQVIVPAKIGLQINDQSPNRPLFIMAKETRCKKKTRKISKDQPLLEKWAKNCCINRLQDSKLCHFSEKEPSNKKNSSEKLQTDFTDNIDFEKIELTQERTIGESAMLSPEGCGSILSLPALNEEGISTLERLVSYQDKLCSCCKLEMLKVLALRTKEKEHMVALGKSHKFNSFQKVRDWLHQMS